MQQKRHLPSLLLLLATAGVTTALPASSETGFTARFQTAKQDLREGRFADAATFFADLAQEAPGKHRVRAWCLSYAARALERDGRYDAAMTLARSIEPPSMAAYTQMEIMTAARQHKELAAAFASEDSMDSWPDQINYLCFFLRGVARTVKGDRQNAAEDFRQCADLAGSDAEVKLDALSRLAALQQELGFSEEAGVTYGTAFALFEQEHGLKGMWLYPRTVLGAARLYMDEAKYDKAETTLARCPVDAEASERGAWDFLVLEAYGDIAAARGRPDDARAFYREAIVIDTHDSYRKRVEGKMEELEGPAK